MTQNYRALKDVGRFSAGEILCALPQATINALLEKGVIELAVLDSPAQSTEKPVELSRTTKPKTPIEPIETTEDMNHE